MRRTSLPWRPVSPCFRLVLLAVSALVAFASVPALALADSSGVQYSDEPPTATGKPPANPPAKTSKSIGDQTTSGADGSPNKGTTTETAPNDESSESEKSASSSGVPGDGGGNGGKPQSSPDNGSKKASTAEVKPDAGTPASAVDDEGDSSPVLPIVIAIVVLAAISVAAMVFHRRKQGSDGGAPFSSPEAG